MKQRTFITMLATVMAVALALAAAAQRPIRTPTRLINSDEEGQRLAAEIRSMMPEAGAGFRATLKTRPRDGQIHYVPVVGSIVLEADHWRMVYHARPTNGAPAESLVIIHRPDQPNEYEFTVDLPPEAQAPSTPRKTPATGVDQSFGASEFWLIDLGMDFLHWPKQTLIKTEMRKSRMCDVLESRRPKGQPGRYHRVRCWLDKEKKQPLLAEAYDQNDKLLKEFSIGSVKRVNGRWLVRDMKISNVQTRSRTWLEFDYDER